MIIEVEVLVNEFEKEFYRFTTFDTNIVFTEYGKKLKPRGKRVWVSEKLFDARETRNKISSVSVPDSVKLEALKQFVESVKVLDWLEWKTDKNKINS